jgi:quercetin dioxygenase-like cupin family protein
MNKKYIFGKIGDEKINKKGFISGALFPEDSLLHDKSIEINYSNLPDDFKAASHYHSKSKTWVIVVKGKMYFRIDEKPIEVNKGEFIVFSAGTHEEVVKVDPETETIVIHSPSFPKGDAVKCV